MTKKFDITSSPIERTSLDIQQPDPLTLEDVEWKVISENGNPLICLPTEGYESLARNTEKFQNRIVLYREIIKEQKNFYEK